MNINSRGKSIKIFLEQQEAASFYADFTLVNELGYSYTLIGEFVFEHLHNSVSKQHGFEVTISHDSVRELLKDLTYKLNREMRVSRVTQLLIDNLTYFLMSDNQKIRVLGREELTPRYY